MTEARRTYGSGALGELALLYARLGITAFGGPAAHIAMMEHELVRRSQWLTHEEFLDLLGVVNLIPGPNSTQMAIQIGYRIAGWPGLLICGICFILPAAVVTLILAWLYVSYGALPQTGAILHGVKAVMVAVILHAIWNLSRTAVKTKFLAAIGALAVLTNALGLHIVLVLFGAGVLAIAVKQMTTLKSLPARSLALVVPRIALGSVAGSVGATAPLGLLPLFMFFMKTGAVLFGSGYVLLAFLRTDLVVRLRWLTDRQLLDAIAVGQVTPGPLFTTATFIGYLLAGVRGATVATIGIFLPSFILIAILGPFLPRLRKSAVFGAFLDGVNIGALALMVVVTWQLGRTVLVDVTGVMLALLSLMALLRFKINSTWLILAGAIVGSIAGKSSA